VIDLFDPDLCRVDGVHCDHYGAGEACRHCGETPPPEQEE